MRCWRSARSVTGRPELYEQYGEQVRAQVDAAVARAEGKEGPSVLYLRATGSSCKVKNSENSVLGEMLAALGCVNIADSDASLLEELSMEAILAADPERIFIVMQGSDQEKVRQTLESARCFPTRHGSSLSAVKNGRVYYDGPAAVQPEAERTLGRGIRKTGGDPVWRSVAFAACLRALRCWRWPCWALRC